MHYVLKRVRKNIILRFLLFTVGFPLFINGKEYHENLLDDLLLAFIDIGWKFILLEYSQWYAIELSLITNGKK